MNTLGVLGFTCFWLIPYPTNFYFISTKLDVTNKGNIQRSSYIIEMQRSYF